MYEKIVLSIDTSNFDQGIKQAQQKLKAIQDFKVNLGINTEVGGSNYRPSGSVKDLSIPIRELSASIRLLERTLKAGQAPNRVIRLSSDTINSLRATRTNIPAIAIQAAISRVAEGIVDLTKEGAYNTARIAQGLEAVGGFRGSNPQFQALSINYLKQIASSSVSVSDLSNTNTQLLKQIADNTKGQGLVSRILTTPFRQLQTIFTGFFERFGAIQADNTAPAFFQGFNQVLGISEEVQQQAMAMRGAVTAALLKAGTEAVAKTQQDFVKSAKGIALSVYEGDIAGAIDNLVSKIPPEIAIPVSLALKNPVLNEILGGREFLVIPVQAKAQELADQIKSALDSLNVRSIKSLVEQATREGFNIDIFVTGDQILDAIENAARKGKQVFENIFKTAEIPIKFSFDGIRQALNDVADFFGAEPIKIDIYSGIKSQVETANRVLASLNIPGQETVGAIVGASLKPILGITNAIDKSLNKISKQFAITINTPLFVQYSTDVANKVAQSAIDAVEKGVKLAQKLFNDGVVLRLPFQLKTDFKYDANTLVESFEDLFKFAFLSERRFFRFVSAQTKLVESTDENGKKLVKNNFRNLSLLVSQLGYFDGITEESIRNIGLNFQTLADFNTEIKFVDVIKMGINDIKKAINTIAGIEIKIPSIKQAGLEIFDFAALIDENNIKLAPIFREAYSEISRYGVALAKGLNNSIRSAFPVFAELQDELSFIAKGIQSSFRVVLDATKELVDEIRQEIFSLGQLPIIPLDEKLLGEDSNRVLRFLENLKLNYNAIAQIINTIGGKDIDFNKQLRVFDAEASDQEIRQYKQQIQELTAFAASALGVRTSPVSSEINPDRQIAVMRKLGEALLEAKNDVADALANVDTVPFSNNISEALKRVNVKPFSDKLSQSVKKLEIPFPDVVTTVKLDLSQATEQLTVLQKSTNNVQTEFLALQAWLNSWVNDVPLILDQIGKELSGKSLKVKNPAQLIKQDAADRLSNAFNKLLGEAYNAIVTEQGVEKLSAALFGGSNELELTAARKGIKVGVAFQNAWLKSLNIPTIAKQLDQEIDKVELSQFKASPESPVYDAGTDATAMDKTLKLVNKRIKEISESMSIFKTDTALSIEIAIGKFNKFKDAVIDFPANAIQKLLHEIARIPETYTAVTGVYGKALKSLSAYIEDVKLQILSMPPLVIDIKIPPLNDLFGSFAKDSELSYRALQRTLKEYRKLGLTDIPLNKSAKELREELRRIRSEQSKMFSNFGLVANSVLTVVANLNLINPVLATALKTWKDINGEVSRQAKLVEQAELESSKKSRNKKSKTSTATSKKSTKSMAELMAEVGLEDATSETIENTKDKWEKAIPELADTIDKITDYTDDTSYQIQKDLSKGSPGLITRILDRWVKSTPQIAKVINSLADKVDPIGRKLEGKLTLPTPRLAVTDKWFDDYLATVEVPSDWRHRFSNAVEMTVGDSEDVTTVVTPKLVVEPIYSATRIQNPFEQAPAQINATKKSIEEAKQALQKLKIARNEYVLAREVARASKASVPVAEEVQNSVSRLKALGLGIASQLQESSQEVSKAISQTASKLGLGEEYAQAAQLIEDKTEQLVRSFSKSTSRVKAQVKGILLSSDIVAKASVSRIKMLSGEFMAIDNRLSSAFSKAMASSDTMRANYARLATELELARDDASKAIGSLEIPLDDNNQVDVAAFEKNLNEAKSKIKAYKDLLKNFTKPLDQRLLATLPEEMQRAIKEAQKVAVSELKTLETKLKTGLDSIVDVENDVLNNLPIKLQKQIENLIGRGGGEVRAVDYFNLDSKGADKELRRVIKQQVQTVDNARSALQSSVNKYNKLLERVGRVTKIAAGGEDYIKNLERIKNNLAQVTSSIANFQIKTDSQGNATRKNYAELERIKKQLLSTRKEILNLTKPVDPRLLAGMSESARKEFLRARSETARELRALERSLNRELEKVFTGKGKYAKKMREDVQNEIKLLRNIRFDKSIQGLATEALAELPRALSGALGEVVDVTNLNKFEVAALGTVGALFLFQNQVENAARSALEFAKTSQTLEARLQSVGIRVEKGRVFNTFRKQANEAGASVEDLVNTLTALEGSVGGKVLSTSGLTQQFLKGFVSSGVTGESQTRALTAISQIASKGVVSMEELRQQLGEAIPSALAKAATSMGMTQSEFTKLVSSGQLLAYDFLPKFAKELQSSGKVADTVAANIARLQNNFKALSESFGVTQALTVATGLLANTVQILGTAIKPLSLLISGVFIAALGNVLFVFGKWLITVPAVARTVKFLFSSVGLQLAALSASILGVVDLFKLFNPSLSGFKRIAEDVKTLNKELEKTGELKSQYESGSAFGRFADRFINEPLGLATNAERELNRIRIISSEVISELNNTEIELFVQFNEASIQEFRNRFKKEIDDLQSTNYQASFSASLGIDENQANSLGLAAQRLQDKIDTEIAKTFDIDRLDKNIELAKQSLKSFDQAIQEGANREDFASEIDQIEQSLARLLQKRKAIAELTASLSVFGAAAQKTQSRIAAQDQDIGFAQSERQLSLIQQLYQAQASYGKIQSEVAKSEIANIEERIVKNQELLQGIQDNLSVLGTDATKALSRTFGGEFDLFSLTQEDIENARKELEKLGDSIDPNVKSAFELVSEFVRLKYETKNLEIDRFTRGVEQAEKEANKLVSTFEKFNNTLEQSNKNIDLNKNLNELAVLNAAISQGITDQAAIEKANQKITESSLQQRLNSYKKYYSEVQTVLRSVSDADRNSIERLIGKSLEEFNSGEASIVLNKLGDEISKKSQEALQAITSLDSNANEIVNIKKELAGIQLDKLRTALDTSEIDQKQSDGVREANKSLQEALKSVGKSYLDFTKGLESQIQSLETEFKKLQLDNKFKKLTLKLKKLRGFDDTETAIDKLIAAVNDSIGIAQESVNNSFDFEEQAREIQTSFDEGIEQLREIQDQYAQAFASFHEQLRQLAEEYQRERANLTDQIQPQSLKVDFAPEADNRKLIDSINKTADNVVMVGDKQITVAKESQRNLRENLKTGLSEGLSTGLSNIMPDQSQVVRLLTEIRDILLSKVGQLTQAMAGGKPKLGITEQGLGIDTNKYKGLTEAQKKAIHEQQLYSRMTGSNAPGKGTIEVGGKFISFNDFTAGLALEFMKTGKMYTPPAPVPGFDQSGKPLQQTQQIANSGSVFMPSFAEQFNQQPTQQETAQDIESLLSQTRQLDELRKSEPITLAEGLRLLNQRRSVQNRILDLKKESFQIDRESNEFDITKNFKDATKEIEELFTEIRKGVDTEALNWAGEEAKKVAEATADTRNRLDEAKQRVKALTDNITNYQSKVDQLIATVNATDDPVIKAQFELARQATSEIISEANQTLLEAKDQVGKLEIQLEIDTENALKEVQGSLRIFEEQLESENLTALNASKFVNPFEKARNDERLAEIDLFKKNTEDIARLEEEFKKLGITAEEVKQKYRDFALETNQIEFENALENVDNFQNAVKSSIGNALPEAIQGLLSGQKSIGDVFKSFLTSIVNDLTSFASKQLSGLLMNALFGGSKSSGGGGVGGLAIGLLGSIFAEGGTVGDSMPSSMVDGLRAERQLSGKKPSIAVVHEGEEILSTLNGDAQFFRSLKKSGMWSDLKMPTYSRGGTVGQSRPISSTGRSSQLVNTTNVTYNIAVAHEDYLGRSERQVRARQQRYL